MAALEETLCPDCNSPMVSRNGTYGRFWGCSNYPDCKGTRDSNGRSKADREAWKKAKAAEEHEDIGPDPMINNPVEKRRWNVK